MRQNALKVTTFTIPAGEKRYLTGPGNFISVEDASAPFEIERDSWGRSEVRGGARLNSGAETWNLATIINLSTTQALTVRLRYGTGDSDVHYPFVPPTENRGTEITLAADAEQVISGVNSSGQRRKHFTISLVPSGQYPNAHILIYNNRTGELIGIVGRGSAGGGFREETDDDIKIVNKFPFEITSLGATPHIAFSQVFYK
jgi:hypothetical protein